MRRFGSQRRLLPPSKSASLFASILDAKSDEKGLHLGSFWLQNEVQNRHQKSIEKRVRFGVPQGVPKLTGLATQRVVSGVGKSDV